MLVRKGMKMEKVLAVRDDMKKVYEEEYKGVLFEEYEGEAEDGGLLSVEVEDGIVSLVEKGMYL